MPAASIIIPAYNEEQNIGELVRRVVAESDPAGWELDDIIVVASGCTDGTAARAREACRDRKRLRVIVEEERTGKANAINIGLHAAQNDAVVLVSGDVMPAPGAIQALLRHLEDPTVGAVGCHPMPLNDPSTFTGFAVHLMWRLHHRISQSSDNPKCGEMIAFRQNIGDEDVVPSIPVFSAVDEVSIQALVDRAGLRSAYEPTAIVSNWGPGNLRDWMKQRRRINAGHIAYSRDGYHPSTMRARTIINFALRDRECWRHPFRLVAVAGLEVLARMFARWDLARGRSHAVWNIAASTKRAIPQEVPQES